MKLSVFIAVAAVVGGSLGNEIQAKAAVKTESNVLTGSAKHTLIIESSTTVANSIGTQKTASIVIRCESGTVDAYIFTPTYNGISFRTKPRVSTRWDGGKITSGSWNASKGGDAIFHPRPKSFIGELNTANTFVFGWQPYSTTPVATQWDLASHKADIKKISELCGA